MTVDLGLILGSVLSIIVFVAWIARKSAKARQARDLKIAVERLRRVGEMERKIDAETAEELFDLHDTPDGAYDWWVRQHKRKP